MKRSQFFKASAFCWKRQCRAASRSFVVIVALVALVTICYGRQPRTLHEVNDQYVWPPEGQNAATYYLDGAKALKISESGLINMHLPWIGSALPPLATQPVPEEMARAISGLVSSNLLAYERLKSGAAFDRARYPLDVTKLHAASVEHLPFLVRANKFLRLSVLEFAINGNNEEATSAVITNFKLGNSLGEEPLFISQTLRYKMLTWNLGALEQLLNRVSLRADQLRRLDSSIVNLETVETGKGFSVALAGERVYMGCLYALPKEEHYRLLTNSLAEIRQYVDPVLTPPFGSNDFLEDKRAQEQIFADLLNAWKNVPEDRYRAFDHILNRYRPLVSESRLLSSGLILTQAQAGIRAEAECLRALRLARVCIALEWHKLHKGSYPSGLEALVPANNVALSQWRRELDKLRYRRISRGFELSHAHDPLNVFRVRIEEEVAH